MTELADRPTAAPYDLADRYRPGAPPMLLTGVQAIARLIVEQRALDRRRGIHTASFISGYQGSPLGGLDKMLGEMPEVLAANDVRFVPGVNEELAATSVWGSQIQLPLGNRTHDGVVGYWYGKGPGLDRATDSLRHATMFGVDPQGGVLILVGDDPASKSSTVPAVSERTLAALGIPVLFPRNAAEIVTLGIHGVEMSRASGCPVALKIVADVADGAWIVDDHVSQVTSTLPVIEWDGVPFTYRQRPMEVRPQAIVAAEADLVGPRTAMVEAYAATNHLDVVDVECPDATLGLVASGSCYDSLRQGLTDLGVDDDALRAAGIRVLRLGLMSPVEPTAIRAFAAGLERLVVVEDKTAFIETSVKELLYGTAGAPAVLGKRDAEGRRLVPADGELTAGRLLAPLRRLLTGRVDLAPPPPLRIDLPLLATSRSPYFCSGCPHNRSTAIPEGSMGGGGIGCHAMVTISDREDSAVTGVTQMGGEGAQWIGQSAFTDAGHVFQNVGDGTFFHSAQLAVQACVAAGVNITYKLLYNNVVAMTGAQDPEGALGIAPLSHKLHHEGVARIIVCSDDPKRHKRRLFAQGTDIWHRDRLEEAQLALRDTPGVTVLIYDQPCAADARRQRKRGTMPARTQRVIINEAVCEGCGDCGMKSNCLSVQPVETEFGRKTRIDQTSCNTDYTCLDGDCPSFAVVEVDTTARTRRERPEPPVVAEPTVAQPTGTWNIFMAGIGGTGIVTVNQVLATAALRAGLEVESLDQTGLSQKAGPVTGHLRFSAHGLEAANRLTPGDADLFLGFDLLTLAEGRNLQYGDPTRTVAVVSTSLTPTGSMVHNPAVGHPETSDLLERLTTAAHTVHQIDGLAAADAIFGDAAAANFLLVGAAYQSGSLGIPSSAIEEAIEINGVAVAANIAAFRWGRASIAAPEAYLRATGVQAKPVVPVHVPAVDRATEAGLDAEVLRIVTVRAPELVKFQGQRSAEQYVDQVIAVAEAERAAGTGSGLSEAVARNLFKLTAYKDEYEVARLLTAPEFAEAARAQVPAGGKLTFKLHPPALRALGRESKVAFGPRLHWMLRLLARLRFLRGTPLDVFGWAKVRRVERALVAHYVGMVTVLVGELSPATYDRAVLVAALPDLVRGYEEIKLANVDRYLSVLETESVDVA
ncbi:MAG: indolepyruvate ferredoxin oxidoreductase family protein, partial [Nocardioides sp.]